MDMRILGKGVISSGEYDNVSIKGNGRLCGKIRCLSLVTSGKSKGETIECTETLKASGSTSFSESINAKHIYISGSLSCGENLTADESLTCFGKAKCEGSLRCKQLSFRGLLETAADIEAESIRGKGAIQCNGLLNAESIEIRTNAPSMIGSIGGSRIELKRQRFRFFIRKRTTVSSSIEGDDITLENVTCPRVTGRRVTIGKGCKIGLVQYSEDIHIRKATIEKLEKTDLS